MKTRHKSPASSSTAAAGDNVDGRQLQSTGGHVRRQGDGGDALPSKIHNTICHVDFSFVSLRQRRQAERSTPEKRCLFCDLSGINFPAHFVAFSG